MARQLAMTWAEWNGPCGAAREMTSAESGPREWACGGEGRKRGENRSAGLSRVPGHKGEERAEHAFGPGMRKGDFSNFQLFSYFVFKTKFKHDQSQMQMGFQTHFSIQTK